MTHDVSLTNRNEINAVTTRPATLTTRNVIERNASDLQDEGYRAAGVTVESQTEHNEWPTMARRSNISNWCFGSCEGPAGIIKSSYGNVTRTSNAKSVSESTRESGIIVIIILTIEMDARIRRTRLELGPDPRVARGNRT